MLDAVGAEEVGELVCAGVEFAVGVLTVEVLDGDSVGGLIGLLFELSVGGVEVWEWEGGVVPFDALLVLLRRRSDGEFVERGLWVFGEAFENGFEALQVAPDRLAIKQVCVVNTFELKFLIGMNDCAEIGVQDFVAMWFAG